MLDICASVGADAVDLTITDSAGDKEQFRRNVSLTELTRMLPALLDDAGRRQCNMIVRPHGPGVTFLQLDDLDADKLTRLRPAMFLALETSPGNHQAWLAIPGDPGKEFARRVRKGTGADPGASGATRISGSVNFKEKYAPDYPRVKIHAAQPGRTTTTAELEQLGLVAPPEEFAPVAPALSTGHHWPSYEKALDGAPLNSAGTGPDSSRADYWWCFLAAAWGHGIEDIAERLMEVSEHARHGSNGPRYAERTARAAALAVEHRRQHATMKRRHG